MTDKNKEKLERKARRKPPIPFTRLGKTKKDKQKQLEEHEKQNNYPQD